MEEKKESLFSIHKMNKYYLLPFLVPFVCYSTKFFSEPMKDNDETLSLDQIPSIEEHKFVFLYQIINSTSLVLGGLLYVVSLIQSRKESKTQAKTLRRSLVKADNDIIVVDYKKRMKTTISLILFMSLIITVYNIIKGYATKHPQLEKRLYFLFFFTLINVFLFKKPIYKHQILSLMIGMVAMLVIFAAFFIEQFSKPNSNYNYIYDVILFVGSILYSLYLVLFKYVTINMSMSPFLCMLLIGSASTVFTILGYSIFSYIDMGNMTYLNFFTCDYQGHPEYEHYVCIGNFYFKITMYTLINTVLQILILLVVYYFSPEIFAISDIISPFFSFLTNIYLGKVKLLIPIISTIISYLVIIFASFIYNEILVCNFWGLNENTWKAIDEKAVHDYMDDYEDYTRDSIKTENEIVTHTNSDTQSEQSKEENS